MVSNRNPKQEKICVSELFRLNLDTQDLKMHPTVNSTIRNVGWVQGGF